MTPEQQLDALYAELPKLDCKRLCANSCGPIEMTDLERSRIADLGVSIPVATPKDHAAWQQGARLDCPALGPVRNHPFVANTRVADCGVYHVRPMICRLWGLSESMRCDAGCVPERVLSDRECYDFLFRAMEIGGHDKYMGPAAMLARQDDLWDDPELGPLFRRLIRGDRSVEEKIATLMAKRSASVDHD